MPTNPARRIAWLIVALGALSVLISATVIVFRLGSTFLSFNVSQIFWLGMVYLVVGGVLLAVIPREVAVVQAPAEPPPRPIVVADPDEIQRLEAEIRRLRMTLNERLADIDSRKLDRARFEASIGTFAPPPMTPPTDNNPTPPLDEDDTGEPLETFGDADSRLRKALVTAGIDTPDKLAAASDAELQAALTAAGMRYTADIRALLHSSTLNGHED
jgi:hypothetical protein